MFKNFIIIGLLIVVFFMVYMRTKSGFEAAKVAQEGVKMGACPSGSELVGNMCLSKCNAGETTMGNVCQTKWSIKNPFMKVRPRLSSPPLKPADVKVAQEGVKMGGTGLTQMEKIAEVKVAQEGVKMGGTGLTQMGKIAELKGPQQAQESMKIGGKIAELKGPQQAQESMKIGGKIAEVKGAQDGMKMCPPGTDRVGAVCLNQCPPGQMTKGQFCSKPCPGGFMRQPDMACFRAFPYKRQPEELYARPVVPMS
jgi:hypothetical protein